MCRDGSPRLEPFEAVLAPRNRSRTSIGSGASRARTGDLLGAIQVSPAGVPRRAVGLGDGVYGEREREIAFGRISWTSVATPHDVVNCPLTYQLPFEGRYAATSVLPSPL